MPISMLLEVALSLGPAETLSYGIGQWPETNGNHRVRIRVSAQADAVRHAGLRRKLKAYVKRVHDPGAKVKIHYTRLSLASWASGPVDTRLRFDWKALGISPEKATLCAPAIESCQPERRFDPSGPIPVEPGKGWLILIGESDE